MNQLRRRILDKVFGPAERYVAREQHKALNDGPAEHCAANCGQPVYLEDTHHTLTLTLEREYEGNTQVLGDDHVGYLHTGCCPRPGTPIVITATVGAPEETRLTADWDRS